MNRRSFLSSMLQAGAAAAFLPSALSYARRWKPTPTLIVPETKIVEARTFSSKLTYNLTFIGRSFVTAGGFVRPGMVVDVNGEKAVVTSIKCAGLTSDAEKFEVRAERFVAGFGEVPHISPPDQLKLNGISTIYAEVTHDFEIFERQLNVIGHEIISTVHPPNPLARWD